MSDVLLKHLLVWGIFNVNKFGSEISIYLYIVGGRSSPILEWFRYDVTLLTVRNIFYDFTWPDQFFWSFYRVLWPKLHICTKHIGLSPDGSNLVGKYDDFSGPFTMRYDTKKTMLFSHQIRPLWTQTKQFWGIYVISVIEYDETIRKIIGSLKVVKI